jgi:branched-subunit amino acid transport protein AzlD
MNKFNTRQISGFYGGFGDVWLSCGLLHVLVWYKFTDVSEVLAASIIRDIMVALIMGAAGTSETSVTSARLHFATQKTAIFTFNVCLCCT